MIYLYSIEYSKVYNYADDNTLSYISSDINEVKEKLEKDCIKASEWFHANYMKANSDKFQIMFLSKQDITKDETLLLQNELIKASSSINVLGVEIDNQLNFNNHINNLCSQTSKQINALKRIKQHLDKSCKNTLYNSYISCNFNYCSAVWMFTGKLNLDKLENTNKRALRFVENENEYIYEDLCNDANKLTIKKRCIKTVAIQMYKIKNKMAPTYMQEMFRTREDVYNLRDNDTFNIPVFKTIKFGRKSFKYYGAKLWINIPSNIRSKVSLNSFKSPVNKWLLTENNLSNIDFL